MVVYIFTALVVCIFATIASANADMRVRPIEYSSIGKMSIFICAAILIIVGGFRYHVGTDYWTYESSFERLVSDWFIRVQTFDEPGLAVIAKIGSIFYDDSISMFFIACLITITLYVYTIKQNSDCFVISMMLFLFIGAWHGSFNAIRQYLAAAVIFAGHRYLYEKRFIKYILIILLAMCFHRTALVMLPAYFIVGRKISIKSIIVLIVSVVVIRYSYDSILSIMSFFKGTDQSAYSYMTSDVNPLRVAVAFAPLVIAVIGKNTLEMQKEETEFYVMLMILNAGYMFAAAGSTYLARVGIYTEIYTAIAMPKLLRCFSEKSRKIAGMIIFLFYAAYWLYDLNVRQAMAYHWWFSI